VAVFWTLPQAAGLQWLFQGLERLPEYALLNFGARLAGLGGVALWVREPGDAGLALLLQAGPGLVLIGGAGWWRLRRLPLVVPAWGQVRAMLAASLPLGLYRILAVSQIAAVPFLLGVFAGPVPLGLFSGAERIVRATISLLDPLYLAIYPRLTRGLAGGRMGGEDGVARLGLTALAAMGGGGAALALLLHAAAPLLVSRLLGPGFTDALPVFEVLTLLVPLTGSALALGPLWTAAIGRDQDLAGVYAIATVGGLALQAIVRPGPLGTAWIAVGSQALLVVCFGALLWRRPAARWTEVSSS
jgi:PST family polysaccharide transporter